MWGAACPSGREGEAFEQGRNEEECYDDGYTKVDDNDAGKISEVLLLCFGQEEDDNHSRDGSKRSRQYGCDGRPVASSKEMFDHDNAIVYDKTQRDRNGGKRI